MNKIDWKPSDSKPSWNGSRWKKQAKRRVNLAPTDQVKEQLNHYIDVAQKRLVETSEEDFDKHAPVFDQKLKSECNRAQNEIAKNWERNGQQAVDIDTQKRSLSIPERKYLRHLHNTFWQAENVRKEMKHDPEVRKVAQITKQHVVKEVKNTFGNIWGDMMIRNDDFYHRHGLSGDMSARSIQDANKKLRKRQSET